MVIFPRLFETALAVIIPFPTMYVCKTRFSTFLSVNTFAAGWIYLQDLCEPFFTITLQLCNTPGN